MMSMLSAPEFAARLVDGITDIYIESVDRYLSQVGELIDVFTFWDDVATQQGWMINPDSYVEVIKPRQKRLFEAIKARTDAKLFYHGCGAVYELIPHLIEIGVDIINPVQVSAEGMDSARLKKAYGDDIVFWGGGVDTQKVLPFGTPDEVRDEVKRRIDDLAPGGGFVFSHRAQHPGLRAAREHRGCLRHGADLRRRLLNGLSLHGCPGTPQSMTRAWLLLVGPGHHLGQPLGRGQGRAGDHPALHLRRAATARRHRGPGRAHGCRRTAATAGPRADWPIIVSYGLLAVGAGHRHDEPGPALHPGGPFVHPGLHHPALGRAGDGYPGRACCRRAPGWRAWCWACSVWYCCSTR